MSTKFPSGVIGPRIRLPSRVHSFLSVVVCCCSDVAAAVRVFVDVLSAIVVRRRWQLLLIILPLVKASERPMRPVNETTATNSVKCLNRRCIVEEMGRGVWLHGLVVGALDGQWFLKED